MICDYCGTQFKTISSLNYHKKNTKYCLKLQNELDLQDKLSYQCQVCLKYFSKNYLKIHFQDKCGSNIYNLNNLIKDLKDKIVLLEKENILLTKECDTLKEINTVYKSDHDCIQDIAKQPRNIVHSNNTNNKILNIITPLNFTNKEDIKNKINDSYKLDYIFSGQKGVAKFAVDHILKDEEGNLKYVCTDPSRQIFKYKDETGEVRKDVEAKKLTNFLVEGGIKDKASKIMNDWWTEETGITNTDKFELLVDKAESLRVIDSDNNDFKKELSTLTTV